MSLINQVLKDLDSQRGPAEDGHVAALQGVGLVQGDNTLWPRIGIAVAVLTGVTLLSVLAYQYSNRPEPVLPNHSATPIQAIEETTVTDSGMPGNSQQGTELIEDPAPVALPGNNQPAEHDREITIERDVVTAVERVETADVPATEDTEIITEKAPDPIKRMSPQQKAEQFYLRSQHAIERQELPRAEALLTQALEEDPYHSEARLQLAGIMLSGQREHVAEELLVTGLALNPRQGSLRDFYAQLLASRGELQAALQLLGSALSEKDSTAETYGLRAAIYARLKDFDRSADDYQKALKRDPKRAEWWTGFAIALEHQGRTEVAVRAYQRALTLPLQEDLSAFAKQRLQLIAKASTDRDG